MILGIDFYRLITVVSFLPLNLEPVEVYAQDHNIDYSSENGDFTKKVAECVPYEDRDIDTDQHFENYEDPEWTEDDYRWKQEEKEEKVANSDLSEVPF